MKKVIFFNTEDQNEILIEQSMVEGLDIELELHNNEPDEALAEVCKDADAVITIYSTVDAAALAKMKRCQVVAVQAIGYNNLDLESGTQNGICMANVPDFCLYDVAMHTASLTIACASHIVPLNQRVKGGKW